MTRPASRLATLLRVRRIEEEIARARLGGAAAAETVAAQQVESAREDYEDRPAVDADAGLPDFLWGRSRVEARAASLRHAAVALAGAAHETGVARGHWSESAMRMTAIERLSERAQEAARLARLAADQRTAEEISAAGGRRSR
jgi:flagellar protein FliJ